MTQDIYELIFRGLQAKYPGQALGKHWRSICAALDGGDGSGNFGHEGRPGKVGGSGEGGGPVKNKEVSAASASDFNKHIKRICADISNNTNKNSVEKVFYRSVENEEAEKIKKYTGLELKGYRHEITNTDIRHIFKKHGNEKTEAFRGQRAVTEKDLCLIPTITKDYDDMLLDTEGAEGKPVLIYKKKIGDEFVYLETVSDKKKELRPKTMYIIKEKKAQHAN